MTETSWAAAGAIGEILGALGVIISVIYLAAQIQSTSRSLKTTIRDNVFHSLDQWNYQLTADPDFAWMFHRGLHAFESLDEKEKPRFLHTIYGFIKLFENIYLHYLDGSIDEQSWVTNRTIMIAFVFTPGAQFYISSRRSAFDPRFLEELDRSASEPAATTQEIIDNATGPGGATA